MRKKIVFNAPINPLSMGQVSFALLKAMKELDVDVSFYPIGQIDFSAYRMDAEFGNWINQSLQKRFNYSKDDLSLKVWHINGAQERLTKNQTLFTFHETNGITQIEKNILNMQDSVFVSSSYTKDILNDSGIEGVSFSPLAVSEGIHKINKDYKTSGYVHFGLMGKFEKRKNTAQIIKLWVKKFGNNPKFRLTCCITNPFYKEEDMKKVIEQVMEGKNYFNVSFLPYLKTNAEVNDFLNSIDIDLTGLSGAEGWNLPAFNATALGKWSCVSNCTAHPDWANTNNAIIVEPSGLQPVYDGVFFQPGQPFNQGHIFTLSNESIEDAFERAVKKAKTSNKEGEKLMEISWKDIAKKILS